MHLLFRFSLFAWIVCRHVLYFRFYRKIIKYYISFTHRLDACPLVIVWWWQCSGDKSLKRICSVSGVGWQAQNAEHQEKNSHVLCWPLQRSSPHASGMEWRVSPPQAACILLPDLTEVPQIRHCHSVTLGQAERCRLIRPQYLWHAKLERTCGWFWYPTDRKPNSI